MKIDTSDMTPFIMSYLNCGILTMNDIRESDEDNLMKSILDKVHNYDISENKDGRWTTYVPDETKPEGRRKIKKKNKSDLIKYLVAFYQLEDKEEYSVKKFSDVFLEWVEYKKKFIGASNKKRSLSPTTIRRYERDYDNYIKKSALATMNIKDITAPKLEEMLLEIIKKNNLKEKFASNILGYISQVMFYAYRNRYIQDNPANYIDRSLILSVCTFVQPKDDSDRVLNRTELVQLREQVLYMQQKYPDYMPNYAIELAMYTGMRVGEISALKWSCIDEVNGIIHVDYSEHRLDYSNKPSELVIGEPKNGKHRTIEMTDDIKRIFYKIKAIGCNSSDNYVFVREDGSRYTSHSISSAVSRRSQEAGIKNASIHGIRRTVSSLLNQVLPQKVVAEMMGHSGRVNDMNYNYSIAERSEKKRALETVFPSVPNIEDYRSRIKKTRNA